MFDIRGGAEFFRRHNYTCIHMRAHTCFFFFTCVKAQQKFLKSQFVIEPNFFYKNGLNVDKTQLKYPWGGAPPPDLYIGGGGGHPPPPPPFLFL